MTDAFAPLGGAKPQPAPDSDGACIMPAPADAPTPAMRHPTLGSPVRFWPYRDAKGGLLGIAARFELNGEKEIRYWTLWRIAGKLRWRCKHWPKPKPLYGLDRLAARPGLPIVICEGEKSTDAAQALMPDYVAMCWPSGAQSAAHADWRPLAERDVVLWPDNDKPGWQAMATVAGILRSLRARRVRMVNRELLAGVVPLAPGDDASDLQTRDGWDAAKTTAWLANPDALIDAPTGIDGDNGREHLRLVEAMTTYLASQALAADATGIWRKDGRHARLLNTAVIAKNFAHDYRFRHAVETRRAIEVVECLARDQAAAAFTSLRSRLTGHPTSDHGHIALARWIYAVTGHQDEEVLWVVSHWIWLVKRGLLGMPRAHDLMPVLFGPQGGGKSTAVARLVSPFAELVEPVNVETLTDNRRATELEKYAIGVWDEMEGAGRADIEALKNTITCETKAYRPMATNDSAQVIRMMSFIGTSNRPVESMVRDTTGARRFFQIDCQAHIDWDIVNAIDYTTLWTAISEDDASPMLKADLRDAVQVWQGRSRGKDTVSLFVEWDSLELIPGFQPSPGVPAITIPAYSSSDGYTAEQLRHRYHYWCRTFGEQAANGNQFSMRLKEEGWEKRCAWVSSLGKTVWRYFRLSTLSTSSPAELDEGGE